MFNLILSKLVFSFMNNTLLSYSLIIGEKSSTILFLIYDDLQDAQSEIDNANDRIEELELKVEELEAKTQVYLKIILAGNNIIKYSIPVKLRQISRLKENKVADLKNLPLCHSHAHGNHLFSCTTCFFKKFIHIKCYSW